MKRLPLLLAPAAALLLQACATGLPARVSRFQALPAPAGQSFYIEAQNPENRGGLEFGRYAALVSQRLADEGYRPAASRADADLVVSLDYGVDDGRERIVTRPGFSRFGPYGYGFGPYSFRYSRFGYRPFAYGWDDPFWFQPFGYPEVRSFTEFRSYLDMDIRDRSGRAVFEGLAQARSRDDDLKELVPPLVEAMFTDFPGRNGDTVRITVPPRARR